MKSLALILLLAGSVLIGYFYVTYQNSTAGVMAISEERDDLPRQIDWSAIDKGDEIATLKIPRLDKQYVTYWGTDDDTLNRGVGMHESPYTTTPDEGGHTLLSGHRDTVFRELGSLEAGDDMIVEFDGKAYTYTITDVWITDAEDRSVIVEKEEATLTLSTCYPFYLLGAAPDRYIIQSELTGITSLD